MRLRPRAAGVAALLMAQALPLPARAQVPPTPQPAAPPPAATSPGGAPALPSAPPNASSAGAAGGGGTGLVPADSWVSRPTADLIILDKLRGQPAPLAIRTGQQASYGQITIAVKGCVTRPPDLPQNDATFLEITDSKGTMLFRGWMFSRTPSVSQLESPLYDVRLKDCS